MNYKYILQIFILMTIMGCRLMDNPQEEETITIPTKISVDIPQVLGGNKSRQKKEKIGVDRIEGEATGYGEIQKYIQVYKDILGEIKSDLLLADQVMDDIVSRCKDRAFEESCLIPPKELSVSIDRKVIKQIKLLFPELLSFTNLESLEGKQLYFGEIEFIRCDENQTYQYHLTMDMSEINGVLGFYDITQPPKIIQSIKWSKDKKDIFSSITKEDKYQQNEPWTLHYHEGKTEENMHINNKKITRFYQESNVIDMTQFKQSSNSKILFHKIKKNLNTNLLIVKQNSSYIELNSTQGFQKVIETETLNENQIKTNREELFDEKGNLVATTYCHSNTPECQLYNSDTWFIDSENKDLFTSFKSLEFEELKIEKNGLKEGEYWLIPKGYKVQELTIQEALEVRVATFVHYVDFYQGTLYDKRYRDKLDTLQLVYLEFNNKLDIFSYAKENQLFELIDREEYPTINLWSETE